MESEKRQSHVGSESEKNGLLVYLHDLVYLVSILVLLFLVVFRVVVVSGSSMNKTLYDGDYLLLLSSTLYGKPQQGDIIVASKESFRDGEPIVKRVIATEGQVVNIDSSTGIVYVDGIALEGDYTTAIPNEGVQFPLTVEEGCVFVMGDNRINSQDSRSSELGLIDEREILGKAIFLFLPGTNKGQMKRDFSRIGGIS